MIEQVERNAKTKWLGEFPEHWQVLRVKNLFYEVESRSETGKEDLLSVSYHTGITRRKEGLENEDDHITNAASLIGYKKVRKDDLIINIMGAWNGRLGISAFEGITSPAYGVYRIKGDNNPAYYGYLFTTSMYIAEFNRNSTGIGTGFLRLYSDKFFGIYAVVPFREEQDEIVKYIKAQEHKINLFIKKKRKFIDLLKEQRQSIINEEIAKGGEGWISLRLKDVATVNDEVLTESTYDDYTLKYIDIGNVNSYGDIFELQKYSFKEAPSRARRVVKKGDVIISTVRTYLQAITLIDSEEDNLIASTGFAVLRPKKNITSQFLNVALRAEYFISSVVKNSYGVSYPAINSSTLSALKLIIPHNTELQTKILFKIKNETSPIDKAVSKAEREIELIQEYKQAMIAAAVMGKIKI